jgi:glycosyltransferase XagB
MHPRGCGVAGGAGMASFPIETGVRPTGARAAFVHFGSAEMLALDAAVNGLVRSRPHLSAAVPASLWPRRVAVALSLLACACIGLAPQWGGAIAAWVMALPFLAIVLIRLAALWHLARPPATQSTPHAALTDAGLPSYSVLIPLYDEAAVAPALVAAMNALDYPADKIEILFVTEASDARTRTALHAGHLTSNMTVLAVPEGLPKTKPRALNYALQFASGDIVAIFDAEDIPEPGQLRQAAAAFAAGGSDLACVQARLNIYNPGASVLTRQFTLEYAALFDAMLPILDRLGLALPLGGTSNHFRREILIEAGAWDPYNVTEDADLGFRLARLGKRVAMLSSITWEEAPATFDAWLGQRTRWLKGWMQTYIVHMRDPRRLWRELGAWQFAGFQITLGGMVLSAVVHPWMYVLIAVHMLNGQPLMPGGSGASLVCWSVLVAGYVSAMALVALAVKKRGGTLLLRSALGLPLYWLAISYAAYCALIELFVRPHHWQKTPHGPRPETLLPFRT